MKEKIKNIITLKNVVCLAFTLICFLLFLFDLKNGKHDGSIYLAFSLISLLVVIGIFILIHCFKKVEYDSYHKFYFKIVLVIGLVFMILAPPFMGSDERAHFYRVYEITEGHLISTADEVGIQATMPRSLNKAYTGFDNQDIKKEDDITYATIPSRLKIPLEKDNQLQYCLCNQTNYFGATVYSPFNYVPHIIGVEIGKILNLGPVWILYLTRICNLLCFALLTAIGIKKLPKFKLPAMLILLSPVVLSGATTVSADGITNAVVFLFIAYILNICYNKKKVIFKDKLVLSSLTFMIAMCKIVYIPIVALLFMLPKESFKNKKNSLIFKLGVFIGGVLLSLGWFYIATAYLNNHTSSSSMQIHYVFTNFINYIFIVIRTYFMQIDSFVNNIFFGNQMYQWSLKTYPIFSLAYVILIIASCFTEKGSFKLSNKVQRLICFICIIILGLIATALFVQHNGGVGNIIGGIQARYFIPVCFCTLMLLNIKKIKVSDKFIFGLFSLLYLPVILTIVIRFI